MRACESARVGSFDRLVSQCWGGVCRSPAVRISPVPAKRPHKRTKRTSAPRAHRAQGVRFAACCPWCHMARPDLAMLAVNGVDLTGRRFLQTQLIFPTLLRLFHSFHTNMGTDTIETCTRTAQAPCQQLTWYKRKPCASLKALTLK